MNRRTLIVSLGLLAWACGDETEPAAAPDAAAEQPAPDAAPPAADAGPEADASAESDTGPGEYDVNDLVGRCRYVNRFSGGDECKAYIGTGWTVEAAETDCARRVLGAPGTFDVGLDCGFASELGRCQVGSTGGQGYVLVFAGDDPADCQSTVVGCETFAGGAFTPSQVCGGEGGLSGVPSSEAYLFAQRVCTPPADGVPGQGPDGTVCTWDGMQGCTEEGRRFIDQASCATPWRQRGYYPVPVAADTPPDDPRLADPAYMADMRWLTAQVEACSCTCCHSAEITPSGPAMWFIEDGPIWIDAVSDGGLAMFAGFAPSETFGAFTAAENNGFSRDRTGLPTTDVERMQRFLRAELVRRGIEDPEARAWPAFGGPLVTQDIFEPEACDPGEGIVDGVITWAGGGARYVYVLEADAQNPGAPPNRFQPEGTLWQVMVDPADAPFAPGFGYGELPQGAAFQALPAEGAPPALVPGQTYYLYVLADIIRPLARCLFVYEG